MRVIFTHLYVIVVAIFVVATGNIIADQYGQDITRSIKNVFSSVDAKVNNVENRVTDWNKKILD